MNMNEADYIASGLKLRVTHNESIIEGIRELQRLALSVLRTPLKTKTYCEATYTTEFHK